MKFAMPARFWSEVGQDFGPASNSARAEDTLSWHATFFEQISTQASTSHQLQNLELCWFTGKQCDSLLKVLKGNHYLNCLKVHCANLQCSVAKANCLSRSVMNGNLTEMILEAPGISCPLKDISKWLQYCFPSLTKLNLFDYCPRQPF